jgi:SAM-dependent methyltransferase
LKATDRWRAELEAWVIPQSLLDAAEESPYGWAPWVWARLSAAARSGPPPITFEIVRDLLGGHGSVLDVGAGRGRASLPLAVLGHDLTAVEPDTGMADGFEEDAARLGVSARLVRGRWPEVAGEIPEADVVMSANVVYDVPYIGPFLVALNNTARRAVVIEMAGRHPRVVTAPLFRAVHGVDRPGGPSVDDLVAVIVEELGIRPNVERWERPGTIWFESWDEILAFYGRRVTLPMARRPELRPLLESQVTEKNGLLYVGDRVGRHCTLWWRTDQ